MQICWTGLVIAKLMQSIKGHFQLATRTPPKKLFSPAIIKVNFCWSLTKISYVYIFSLKKKQTPPKIDRKFDLTIQDEIFLENLRPIFGYDRPFGPSGKTFWEGNFFWWGNCIEHPTCLRRKSFLEANFCRGSPILWGQTLRDLPSQ